jgi:hypothetical protein
MPLHTQIERDGQPLELRWGWWHVQCMQEAAILDVSKDWGIEAPWEQTPLYLKGVQMLHNGVTFEDPSDGEILELKPGDVLHMSR